MTESPADVEEGWLTLASGDYAHTRSRAAETLPGPNGVGVGLHHVNDRPASIFRRALAEDAPFDIAEMSLATAYVLADQGDPRFVALPVFPSRLFRHGFITVARPAHRGDPLRHDRGGVGAGLAGG